jgi:hypothetical protein
MEKKLSRMARLRTSPNLPWIIFSAVVVLLLIGAGLYLWITRGLPILDEVLSAMGDGALLGL